MTIEYPLNWQNCWLVLSKHEPVKLVLQFKPIVIARNTQGDPLDFYSVKASKFGLPIGEATHWSVCELGVAEPRILVESPIPYTGNTDIISLNEKEAIFLKRYNKNFSLSIGLKKEFRPKTKSSKTSSTEVFTIEESLELLYT